MQICHIEHTPLFSIKYGWKYEHSFTLMTLNVQIKVSKLFQQ